MAWNTSFAKYRSTQLTNYDCTTAGAIKMAATKASSRLYGLFTTPATGMEVGTCALMIRVPAGTTIVGAELAWAGTGSAGGLGTNVMLGVGDPFACGRFIGPVVATTASGTILSSCASYYGTCAVMHKVGPAGSGGRGDACGIGYTYTCETDIILTNLYKDTNAAIGGWVGGADAAGNASTTAIGTIVLILDVLPV